MSYRVIQWGTGRVGAFAVAGIVGHPHLELVGTWVHSEDKDRRDVGELCGLDRLGVEATRDTETLLAMSADCVSYAVARDAWGTDVVDDLVRILRTGKNVVNVTWPSLVNPRAVPGDVFQRLQEACVEGESSLYTAGIDPGYGSMGLALSALGATSEVRGVRMYEVLNYAHWDNPEWLCGVMGFGRREVGSLFSGGRLRAVWEPMLHLLADAMGTRLDSVDERYDAVYADEPFDVPASHIAAGTISGIRFEIRGFIGGEPRIVVEHVTKLRDEEFPEVDFEGGGYRVEVDGEPCVRLDMKLSLRDVAEDSLIGGASGRPAIFATAMAAVNAIPQVCSAPPGVMTCLDLRPHPSPNIARHT